MLGQRILLAGATGYIGRAVVSELIGRGHTVVALLRSAEGRDRPDAAMTDDVLRDVDTLMVDVTDRGALRDTLRDAEFDGAVSCLASRTGVAADAWAVDCEANRNVLDVAKASGVSHFVLLSAICVQRPRLSFQHAKLRAEEAVQQSGIGYSIVRPTAFFKSLSGQVRRVQDGKPFLVFGDGTATACKPIGERDLAAFIVDCLERPAAHQGILPIGGPGSPITPRQQGELLFELCGRPVRFRRVPVAMFDVASALLSPLGKLVPGLAAKAELARIGKFYATESMLLWNEQIGAYDAEATPVYGGETLREFYRRVIEEGLAGQSLGDQRMF